MTPVIASVVSRNSRKATPNLRELANQFIADNVPTKMLTVDYSYARAMTPARMRAWDSRGWDGRKAGTLAASMRNDGTYAVIDGQGRVYLALKQNIETVPCRVYIDLTVGQEAELYLAFNRDRAATQPVEDFKAKIISGDKQAIDIASILSDVGLKAERGGHKTHATQAISTLEDMYQRLGRDVVIVTLNMLRSIWPADGTALTADMIRGMAAFAVRYGPRFAPKPAMDELVRKLGGWTPTRIKGQANTRRELSPGMSPEQAVGQTIAAVYDKGRRNKLPPWQAYVQGPAAKETASARSLRSAATRKANAATSKP
jgi:hypothetical protein